MFLLFSLSFAQEKSKKSVYIGAVDNINDNFRSHMMPGFHFCGKKKFPVVYSIGEDLIPINFTNKSFYEHCQLFLDEEIIDQFNSEFLPNNYLSFYYNNQKESVKFFSDNKTLMTHYEIQISDESDSFFKVKALNPTVLEQRTIINITFSMVVSKEKVHEAEKDDFSTKFIFVSFINISIIIIAIYSYKRYFITHEHIPVIEIWKRSIFHSNIMLFTSTGVLVLVSLFILYFKARSSFLSNSVIYSTMIISTIIISFLRGQIGKVCGDLLDDSDLVSPCFLVYVMILMPVRVFTVFTRMYGIFRGTKIIKTIMGDGTTMLFVYIISMGVGSCFNGMDKEHEKIESIKNGEKIKRSSFWKALSYIASFISALIVFPSISNIVECVINQSQPNYLLYFASLLLYQTIIGLLSLFKTASKLSYGGMHWMYGHFDEAMYTSLISFVLYVGHLASVKGYRSLQGVFYIMVIGFSYVIVLFCVGTSGSFLTAFALTTESFPRKKNV